MPSMQGPSASAGEGAPLFSIIMPCYDVAGYIDAAIDDIQVQSVSDWELICVDDGSPDDVAARVAARADADPRIRLVGHESNQGLSAARNTGLAHARGRYVWIPDPDDGCDPELLATVLAEFERPDASGSVDVVVFGCRERYLDGSGAVRDERDVLPPFDGVHRGRDLHGRVLDLEESTLYGYAWNKVYRREVLDGLVYESTPLIEDILFNIAVFDRAHCVAVVARPLYRYAKRLGANLTNKFVPEYYEVHHRRIAELYAQQRRWGIADEAARSRLGSLYARYIMSALERNCDPRAQMRHADRVAWCRRLLADPLYQDLLPVARSRGGRALSLCIPLVRSGSVLVLTALGRLIHIVRNGFGGGYARLKMQR